MPAILEFPPYLRKKTWWITVMCAFFSFYIFVILAIVCDDYLLPAMERLCYSLKLSYDVAGATFLAASTSAPELFINCVGTFITHSDIGIGTIVGSSVFNILVISSVCGILTNATKLEWWPVTRDIFWYLLAILLLVGVMWDSIVEWYEALAFLIMYVVYFLQLLLDKRIKKCFKKTEEEEPEQKDPMSPERQEEVKTFRSHLWGPPEKGSKCCSWFWWIFTYPAELLLALTIPNPRTVYLLTLMMSIVWISLISYLVSWFITIVGHNVGIPDSIMGITFLAAGTSVPEIVSSYIVSKKGHGAMAICNAFGSNTFDILICLGLPWFLQSVFWKEVKFDSSALIITTAMLVVTSFVMYTTLAACRFVLGKVVGWVCLVWYVIFLVSACSMEMLYKKKVVCDVEYT
ncbi:sodium/potassium/calcium exchanger 5 isoform X2 [Drosophila kikkawai]|nr:sodium/potassium/calcium exchanger 4 isoform X2 [Drosophila kikkawai]